MSLNPNASDLFFLGDEIITPKNEGLQRTEEWLKLRGGKFTGSENTKLMSCGRSTAKQAWGGIEKLVDFGAAAEKYIYNVGRERETGLLSMQTTAQRMEHGKEHEPLLIEQLLKDNVITDFEERGFEQFYENGGASVDGIATYQGRKVFLELKCTTSFDGEFQRLYRSVDEKHNDFWQINSEGLSVSLDECLYVVAAPMQVKQYKVILVKCSKIHQEQLFKRCMISDKAISLWPKHGYKKALQVACAEFKEEYYEEFEKEVETSPDLIEENQEIELPQPEKQENKGISENDLPF